ncbi:MAG: efflux RND transporter periplasmic adaptor subunit [Hyphomicrobiales bacterium]
MKWSYVWAFFILAAIGVWLGSDQLQLRERLGLPPKAEITVAEEQKEAPTVLEEKPFRVVVKTFIAEPRADVVAVRGRTEASRRVEARARTVGIVEESPRKEGEKVKRGDLLCRVDIAGREAKLAEAKATLASAKRDFEASDKLQKKNYASKAKLATDRARAEAAQAAIDQIERDITYTTITSPITGIIEAPPAEKGAFLQIGHVCATIVDLDPITISAMVSERDIASISLGMPAMARLITGEELKGKVEFISPKADISTRTFKVEIDAPNEEKRVRDGLTAELIIPLNSALAHKLPSSALTLHDNGTVGVSTVTAESRVKFIPIKIINFGRDHVWVSGLEEKVTVITVGQEYVLDGHEVEPVTETAAKTAENAQ